LWPSGFDEIAKRKKIWGSWIKGDHGGVPDHWITSHALDHFVNDDLIRDEGEVKG